MNERKRKSENSQEETNGWKLKGMRKNKREIKGKGVKGMRREINGGK